MELAATPIAGVIVVNMEWIREALDDTTGSDDGWQHFHGTAGRKGLNLSVEGLVSAANKVQLMSIYDSLSNAAITLITPYTDGTDQLLLSADNGFAMTALSFGANEKELVSFSMSLSSSGEVTETALP